MCDRQAYISCYEENTLPPRNTNNLKSPEEPEIPQIAEPQTEQEEPPDEIQKAIAGIQQALQNDQLQQLPSSQADCDQPLVETQTKKETDFNLSGSKFKVLSRQGKVTGLAFFDSTGTHIASCDREGMIGFDPQTLLGAKTLPKDIIAEVESVSMAKNTNGDPIKLIRLRK